MDVFVGKRMVSFTRVLWGGHKCIIPCANGENENALWVTGLGTRVSGLGSRDSGLGSRVSGLGSRVSGLGHWEHPL